MDSHNFSKKSDIPEYKQRPDKTVLGVNLSSTPEQTLEYIVTKTAAKRWENGNKFSIAQYNDFVEENGCFGDEYWNTSPP